jgi:NADH:ubiquinone oxidoreductase subunit B-like Fe-S oxidoreductase
MISNQNASLLTTPMNVQVYIPSGIKFDPQCLMKALRLQSELISDTKQTWTNQLFKNGMSSNKKKEIVQSATVFIRF